MAHLPATALGGEHERQREDGFRKPEAPARGGNDTGGSERLAALAPGDCLPGPSGDHVSTLSSPSSPPGESRSAMINRASRGSRGDVATARTASALSREPPASVNSRSSPRYGEAA